MLTIFNQNARRARVEMCLGPDIYRLYDGAVVVQQGARVGKSPLHALRGLAGALGILPIKVVKPAAGMGVDQGQRALFLLQGPHEGDQQAVLDDIGAIAGMEGQPASPEKVNIFLQIIYGRNLLKEQFTGQSVRFKNI